MAAKARAMLDALMGPGRDVVEKDKGKSKEKFKDKTVCKAFLVGMCPLDPSLLGGKRKFSPCELIHSEVMRQQYEAYPDKKDLEWEYKNIQLKSLEYVVRECDARILSEKARIRDDWGNRRPPLPGHVIDVVSRMKRESSAMFAMAEQLDDDRFKEKEAMITKSQEIMKEAEAVEEKETKKIIATADTEKVCEVCGTCFQGASGDAAHKSFKIHGAYEEIRTKLEELLPFKKEWEAKQKEKDGEASKKRMEDFKKQRKEKDKESGDKGSDAGEDDPPKKAKKRDASRSASKGKKSKDKDKDKDKKRDDSRARSRSGRGRGGRDRRRDDSRSKARRRDDSRPRDRRGRGRR